MNNTIHFNTEIWRGLKIGAALLLAAIATAGAQDGPPTLAVERTYYVDERGDARVEQSFQLGARDWAQWKHQFGDHPDILLRNLKYQMASSAIENYALEKDEVHRRGLAKITARAFARYRGDGQFAIQVPKDMKLVTGSGSEWVFTSSGMDGGVIMNFTDRAKLPSNARDVRVVPGNDFNQLVYTVPQSQPRPLMLLLLGGALLFFGIVTGLASLAIRRKAATPPPLPPHPMAPPPLPSAG